MNGDVTRERIILFVVGMHRSGTSALASAFCAIGATTGSDTLAPMKGVNDEGFWEDRLSVELNEALLRSIGLDWFDLEVKAYMQTATAEHLRRGREILERGFGDGEVQLLKDPRLCITLPFWLQLCKAMDVVTRVCVIERTTTEVALSLQKRDSLPFNYCLQLAVAYQNCIATLEASFGPFARVRYDNLLADPQKSMTGLVAELKLPLNAASESLQGVIHARLKHQVSGTCEAPDNVDSQQLLREVTSAFLARGQQLTDVGEQHARALSTLRERDGQVSEVQKELKSLGAQHEHALKTLRQRDSQLSELQQHLTSLGEQHRYAISVVEERDLQLQQLQAELKERDVKLQQLQAELELHKSWKSKIKLALGLTSREK